MLTLLIQHFMLLLTFINIHHIFIFTHFCHGPVFFVIILFTHLPKAPFPRTRVVIATKLHRLQVFLLLFKNKGPFPRTRAVDAAR